MSMIEPIEIHSVNSISEIPEEDWDRLANPADEAYDPFLRHSFFLALEESGSAVPETGWGAMHLIARDVSDHIVGIMPLYLKGHSQGEYVFDHGWARGFQMAGGRYYPKLLCAVPFTPVTGRRIFAEAEQFNMIANRLLQVAMKQGELRGLSSLHLNFIQPKLIPLMEQNDLLIRHDTQFHWQNKGYKSFDEFLDSLQSRKRKAIRKERRAALSSGLEVEWLRGDDLKKFHWDEFYTFYTDTFDRKWGRPYLTRSFFEMINNSQANDIVLMLAKRDDSYIAGALNFVGSDVLYGRYWGAREHHEFLHFELCYYQAIDYAIENGLSRVEAGAQGEHKLLRGYSPDETTSAHYIVHQGLRNAVQDFLQDENHFHLEQTEILKDHLPYKKGDPDGV